MTSPTPPASPDARRSIITTIATSAARRWPAAVGLLLVVVVLGGYAFGPGLAREGFPPINTPFVVVTGQYFVDDVERVDAEVAQVLEAAFADVDGVEETSTESRPNSFGVFVTFDDSFTSDQGREILEALDVDVPDTAIVDYRPVNAARFVGRFDLLVAVVGPEGATPADLEAQAAIVADAIAADENVLLAEVRDLLTPVPDAADGEPQSRLTRFTRVALDAGTGYQGAIGIGVERTDDESLDVLEFSDRIAGIIDDTEPRLAEGYVVAITADFATGVRQQLSTLSSNLITGLAAVGLVSLALIGWRTALVTAGFMGVVLLGALVLLWTIGFSLNTITLFGLILTLGLLVDDAIVISESIDSSRSDPDPSEDVAEVGVVRRALDRVGSASFAGTLTTVVVFSPMLFVGGILGEFVRPIPATVILTLLASFLFSIVFIPAVARAFLLRGAQSRNPIVRTEKRLARRLGRMAAFPSGNGWRGRIAGLSLVLVSVVAIMTGGALAGGLGFSIFPSGDDASGLTVSAQFPPGTTIEEAQEVGDRMDEVVLDVVGDELVRSQYLRGNERTIEIIVDLTPIDERSTAAPTFVAGIEDRLSGLGDVRITVNQLENGPGVAEFPFRAQIELGTTPTPEQVAGAEAIMARVAQDLRGQELDVPGGPVTVIDTIVSTRGEIERLDQVRFVEVRAKYDDEDGIDSTRAETEVAVSSLVSDEELQALGLPADALTFDYGADSDNADDFAALGVAGLVALVLMLVLLAVQFRSLAQPLLIFLAIPFSFLGVFSLLTISDNPLSFLVTVGFIALIGVAVNNTILLVDAANQERDRGATAAEAIGIAVERRFRPLVVTTATTAAGLLPLSLSDPFWESLGLTLVGGLISSTILVLVSFPAYYLAMEAVRTPVRNAVRRRRGRPELA